MLWVVSINSSQMHQWWCYRSKSAPMAIGSRWRQVPSSAWRRPQLADGIWRRGSAPGTIAGRGWRCRWRFFKSGVNGRLPVLKGWACWEAMLRLGDESTTCDGLWKHFAVKEYIYWSLKLTPMLVEGKQSRLPAESSGLRGCIGSSSIF